MKEELIDSSEKNRGKQILKFFRSAKTPPKSIEYFEAIPWLRAIMKDANYELRPMFSRHPKTNDEDYVVSQTLNTATTFPHWIQLFRKDVKTIGPGQTLSSTVGSTPKRHAIMETPAEAVFLVAVGPRDLSANAGYMHGGIVSLILDNCMSSVVTLHCLKLGPTAFEGALFTARMEVGFFAPVKCDSNIVVHCWLVSRQKNKWTIRAQIVDEFKQVLAQGDSLWIVLGSKL